MKSEIDVSIDPHQPRELVAAVESYLDFRAQFKYERRLALNEDAKWTGWFCDRCCWNVPLQVSQISTVAIQDKFDAHSCEAFAGTHWLDYHTQKAQDKTASG